MNNKKTTVKASFEISGDYYRGFSADEISKILDISPTIIWGSDNMETGGEKPPYYKWSLSTEFEEELDIEVLLNKLLNDLNPKRNELKQLKEKYHVSYEFVISIRIENGQTAATGFDFGSLIIDFADDVEAEIDFDIYIGSLDEESLAYFRSLEKSV